jgi:hypothetical protein
VIQNSKTGVKTRNVAKKLLFTIVPSDTNTAPFDLDQHEKKTFQQFRYSASYVGIVSHPSLSCNSSILNTPSVAQPSNWSAAVPASPYNTRFENYPDSPYYRVIAVGDQTLTGQQARKLVTDAFDQMVKARTLRQTTPAQELKFHSLH